MGVGTAGGAAAPSELGHFGKYQLIARLATGGMAEVFLARYVGVAGFERDVVIKRVLPHHARDERFVTMFLAEARITARLSHPNICHVYELGEIDGHYYMAMEYLEGVTCDTLSRRLKLEQKPTDLRLVAGLIVQACEGLHHAHELKSARDRTLEVVHRDVSPHNLFITTSGVLKVLDFGVAKAKWATPRTDAGVVKGTYSYMSPEQLKGETLDRRADIFGLGIVLFELLTLKRLFHRESDFLIFNAITTDDIPKVTDLRPELPPDLAGLSVRALSRNRDDRMPSARELGLGVSNAVESLGGPLLPAKIASEIRRLCGDDLEEVRDRIRAGGRWSELDEDTTAGDEPPTVRPGWRMLGEAVREAANAAGAGRPAHPPIAATEEKATVPPHATMATPGGAGALVPPAPDLQRAKLPSPDSAVQSAQSDPIKLIDEGEAVSDYDTTTTRPNAEGLEETDTTAASSLADLPRPTFEMVPVPEDPYDGPTNLDSDPLPEDTATVPSHKAAFRRTIPAWGGPKLQAKGGLPLQPRMPAATPAPPTTTPAPPQQPRVTTDQIKAARLEKRASAARAAAAEVPDLRSGRYRFLKLFLAFAISAGVGTAVLLAVRYITARHARGPSLVPAPGQPEGSSPTPAAPPPPAATPVPEAASAPPPGLAPGSPPPLPSPKARIVEDNPPDPVPPEPRKFPKATRRSGFLTVEGKPGQTVFLDGKNVGPAPLKRYPLDPGRHDVVITPDKGKKKAKSKHFIVRIEKGKEAYQRVP